MDSNQIADLTVFIAKQGDELVTDSRAVAIAFGKRHADVLRSIERMAKSLHEVVLDHYQRNFALVEFIDSKGEQRPMYRMTEKGFSELAMSFTGEPSRVVRIKFLNAFEAVAGRLQAAERSILDLLHQHDRRAAVSETKGRIGSKLMNERRKEKPALADEADRLAGLAQPSLLN